MDDPRITKLLGQLGDAIKERIQELNQPLEMDKRSIEVQVEQRKQLARQLQLPKRLYTIYDEVEHYPHWIKNHLAAEVSPLVSNVSAVSARPTLGREEANVRFSLKGCFYTFLFEDTYDGESNLSSAELTLIRENDESLFRFSLSRYGEGEYEMGDVRAFIPGNWVLDFMELSESLASIAIKRNRKYQLSRIERQKQDFGLNVGESELQTLRASLTSYGIGEDHRPADVRDSALGRWLRRLFR